MGMISGHSEKAYGNMIIPIAAIAVYRRVIISIVLSSNTIVIRTPYLAAIVSGPQGSSTACSNAEDQTWKTDHEAA